ncbi:FHA domain-containing protein [Planctomycetota bacterium]
MQCTFHHMTGSKRGQAETLTGDRITVGRDPANSVVFDPYVDIEVSGHHAELTLGPDGKYMIADLGSSNGTFLNGQKVGGTPIPCEPGSKVKFGKNGPECKVDYKPGAAQKVGQTREMLAQVQQDLEAEKQKTAAEKQKIAAEKAQADASRKRSRIVMVVVFLVMIIGGAITAIFVTRSSKQAALRKEAEAVIARIDEVRDEADMAKAGKYAKILFENATARAAEAQDALDAESFLVAKELAQESREGFRNAAKIATLLSDVDEARASARQMYAKEYAPEKYKEATDLAKKAYLSAQGGDFETARSVAEQSKKGFKQAEQLAYVEGVKRASRRAAEKAKEDADEKLDGQLDRMRQQQEDMRRKSEEDARKRKEEIARQQRELEAATEEQREKMQKKLQEQLDELAARKTDNERIQECIGATKTKVALIETELFVKSEETGAESSLGVAPRYGSGFLYGQGFVVTSKRTLFPQLFEPELRAEEQMLAEQGRKLTAKYAIWVYHGKSARFVKAFSSQKGTVELGPAAANVLNEEESKITVDIGGMPEEVGVKLHDALRGNVATLKLVLASDKMPKALEAAEKQPSGRELLASAGAIMETTGEPGTVDLSGSMSRAFEDGGEQFGEITTAFEAPASLVGSAVMNLDKQVIGILVQVGKAHVKYAPISTVDAILQNAGQ